MILAFEEKLFSYTYTITDCTPHFLKKETSLGQPWFAAKLSRKSADPRAAPGPACPGLAAGTCSIAGLVLAPGATLGSASQGVDGRPGPLGGQVPLSAARGVGGGPARSPNDSVTVYYRWAFNTGREL